MDVEQARVSRLIEARVPAAPWRVVELGCGSGLRLEGFAQRGALHLIGVDASEALLREARSRLPGARLLCRDLSEPLPLPSGCADLVLMSLALGPGVDAELCFTQARRLLSPGGELLVIERSESSHSASDLLAVGQACGLLEGSVEPAPVDDSQPEQGAPPLVVGSWRAPPAGGPESVDLSTWPRASTFAFFRTHDDPFFNVCATVDIGHAVRWCKAHSQSFFLVSLHAVMRAVHAVPELRLRLQGEQVVLHAALRCGSTVINADESFGFVYFDPQPQLEAFVVGARQRLWQHRERPGFEPGEGTDVVHLSVVPWVRFSSISHARNHRDGGSVPKITLGQYHEAGGATQLPVSIEVHHALADGLHVGRFFQYLERAFAEVGSGGAP